MEDVGIRDSEQSVGAGASNIREHTEAEADSLLSLSRLRKLCD